MSNSDFGSLTVFLFLLLALARLLGHLFVRLRQPRVVGEILAGLLLGPSVLGHFTGVLSGFTAAGVAAASPHADVISFLYNFGLLLLMFASGAESRGIFKNGDRREVAWLGAVGTGLPFLLTIAIAPFLPLQRLAGTVHARAPLLLVLGIAVAVTSIPVISRILHDLKILHTRFARLVLSVAVLEDIALWALLAVATALAQTGVIPSGKIVLHVCAAMAYFVLGLLVAPKALRALTRARWNILVTSSPIAYVMVLLLAYSALASLFDVSLVFAAFLAGYALVNEKDLLSGALHSISEFSFAVFIPIYFAVVGYQLDLGRTFSLGMLLLFLFASSLMKLLSAGVGARMAGFRGLDCVNLAAALNARGGPGIVLASVAYGAGIINATFYTTLVLVAVLTSQAAGVWLEAVLHAEKPLLAGQAAGAALTPSPAAEQELAA